MTKFHIALAAGAALFAAPAFAQDAPAAPAPQSAAPASPAASVTGAVSVSDAELKSFAKAAIAVDKVSKDTTLAAADKNKKLADVVTASGLEPTRFNELATASGTDAALKQRVDAAVVAEQQATATPAPGQ